jgi:aerobic-type carbon monoxide dehydrogenase small subunit (CoxS/CutS family)
MTTHRLLFSKSTASGACTVHVDETRVLACLIFAAQAEGRTITTIEGLSRDGGALHPVQAAFLERDAFQCGYCTLWQIMSAVACIREGYARVTTSFTGRAKIFAAMAAIARWA